MESKRPSILVENLNFGYQRGKPVLRNVNLSVPASSIYGFLGANGAGKTTTIRTILGLLKADSGQVKFFDETLRVNRNPILKRIGVLIEEPSLYKHLSGFDNVMIACKYFRLAKTRIDEVLELVGLQSQGNQLAKNYSTGMKQRLGLAISLLNDPELLILDEPTNGLDPMGIIEIRGILKKLNAQGKTIFLSSHLLTEIEKIADKVGIIKNGQMIFEGSITQLASVRNNNVRARLVSKEIEKVVEFFSSKYTIEPIDSQTADFNLTDIQELPEIIRQIGLSGLSVYEVYSVKNDLENMFIYFTEEAGNP